MKKVSTASARLIGGMALVLALTTNAIAAPTATKFDNTAKVEGATLTLNGAGTRFKNVFRVYDVALYTQQKVTTREDLLALPGPKRIDVTALRELNTTDIGLAFVQGMRANATKEQTTRHLTSMSRLIELFSTRAKLMPGDHIGMQYTPGKGTTFFVMGEAQGAPVGDAEFFNMVLSIWVGHSPAQPMLKDALLGQ